MKLFQYLQLISGELRRHLILPSDVVSLLDLSTKY
jgi:hypothetical protein